MSKFLAQLLFLAAVIEPPIAVAALGGNTDSVEADRAHFKASKQTPSARFSYTIHTLTTDWVTIREYVSASGNVFGVAWEGSAQPDLQTLFGPYWEEFQTAFKNRSSYRHSRSGSAITTSALTVEMHGHMRSLHGRAFLTALLPIGVSPEEIR